MTSTLILDILLVLIVLLWMPIGFWRGTAREVFVAAAILLGIASAPAWEDALFPHFPGVLSFGSDAAQFTISVTAVAVTTLLLGYAGSRLTLGSYPVGLTARFGGVAVGVVNAVVLLGWSLDQIRRDLADASATRVLEEARVSGFLLRDFDTVLITASMGLGLIVIAGFVRRVVIGPALGGMPPVDATSRPPEVLAHHDRMRAVRLPRDADAGKFEPAPETADPTRGWYGAGPGRSSQSRTLGGVDPGRWSTDRATPPVRPQGMGAHPGSRGNGRYSGREWLRRPTGPTPTPAAGADLGRTATCFSCGNSVSASDTYCSRCGRAVRS